MDNPLLAAAAQIRSTRPDAFTIKTFFHEPTFTATHVIICARTRKCAVIDSVLDFDPASGRTSTKSADALIAYLRESGSKPEWLLETHAHADHLSAAPYIKAQCGGRIGVAESIRAVQAVFAEIFNLDLKPDGADFDHLFADGEIFSVGDVPATALHVPGHTPADMAYVIGDAAFIGDTLFMPDYGTARADFPGGDAGRLHDSIRRLLSLPEQTRLLLCHDYKAPGRDSFAWETNVADERLKNIHVHDGVGRAAFVAMRQARDATLDMPRLILPSIQVNIRAGRLPAPEANGVSYLKLPLDRF